ncbi:MAG: GGDEF domain-containing protein, partial [Bdellovibrionia bacterium]
FVDLILQVSEEIKFIMISSISQFDILSQYNSVGLLGTVSDDPIGIESRVLWAVDRACESLYWQYMNEQLHKENQRVKADLLLLQRQLEQQREKEVSDLSVSLKINEYMSGASKEEILQKFMNSVHGLKMIYFKFLPSVRSFVATHTQGFPVEMIQGVGAQLTAEEMKDLNNQISVGLLPPSFSKMLIEAFRFNPPKGWPLYALDQLEGVVVYNGEEDANKLSLVNEEFSLLRIAYSHFALEKKVDALEILDPVTEVLNRNAYAKELHQEYERARRLRHPLSVVKVAIDDFDELGQALGINVRDSILKSIALLIQKTSRSHDKTARTSENEIAMILPHCSKKGAALRGERVRRIIESSQLIDNGLKVTVSLGISEFPTLCENAKELDASATKALEHIFDKGGNKICLFKAATSHQPEFAVAEE